MSDKPESKQLEVRNNDFTHFDLKAIEKYQNDGMPGLAQLTESSVIQMMELYLAGKTYREISHLTNKPKAMILFLSNKFEWYAQKAEYLRDLEETMFQRTMEAKLVGQDFLLQIKQLFEKKIGDKINNYLRTGDVKFADEIDIKEIDKYIKTFETLDKLTQTRVKVPNKTEKAVVNVNLGDSGATITRVGENSVEVTPKQKSVGEMLKKYADFRRQEINKTDSDISNKTTKGDNNESH